MWLLLVEGVMLFACIVVGGVVFHFIFVVFVSAFLDLGVLLEPLLQVRFIILYTTHYDTI